MRVEIIFSLIALIQKLSGVLFCSRVELIGTQVDGIMSPSGLKTFCKRDFFHVQEQSTFQNLPNFRPV